MRISCQPSDDKTIVQILASDTLANVARLIDADDHSSRVDADSQILAKHVCMQSTTFIPICSSL